MFPPFMPTMQDALMLGYWLGMRGREVRERIGLLVLRSK